MLARLFISSLITISIAHAQGPAAPDPTLTPVTARETLARVLDRYVDDQGRIDFASLAGNRVDLDRYVAWVHAIGPRNHPELFPARSDVLAYHINAYNALAMLGVIDVGMPQSLGGLRKLTFFYLREVKVGGDAMSLYAYENKVIRPLGEERVHFALNCMAAGCPRLPRLPFDAKTLDTDLEREAKKFFNEDRNVEADAARRVVRFSQILDFYPSDFLAKAPSLIAYANRYRTSQIPADYRVEFIPYDWTVNRQKP